MKSQTIKETVYSRTELMLGEEGLEKLRTGAGMAELVVDAQTAHGHGAVLTDERADSLA